MKGINMLTKQYGKEPFDLQLCLLLFARKLWVFVLGGVVGGLLIGGIYTLKNVVFAPVPKYEMVSEYYMEYALNQEGKEYTAFNQVTWGSMIYADDIIEPMLLKLNEIQKDIINPPNKEQVKQSISATLLSDTRILTTTVVGDEKEEVENINTALLFSLEEFGKNQKEFVTIRPMNIPEQASIQKLDIRVWNATILGIVIGLSITGFCLLLFIAWDDRIYVPDIFEKRYNLPMLGCIKTPLCKENAKEIRTKENPYTILLVDKNTSMKQVGKNEIWENITGETNADIDRITLINNPFWEAENLNKINTGAKILLVISAARHNCKLIETTLQIIEKREGQIIAGVLIEDSKSLQKQYYFPAFLWSKKYLK